VDETAHDGARAPAALKESGPGEAEPSPATLEAPVAESPPPAVSPSHDPESAEPVSELPAEPVAVAPHEPILVEPAAAASSDPVAAEAGEPAAALEVPTAPVAPAQLAGVVEAAPVESPAGEPEAEPLARDALAGRISPADPVLEAAPSPIAQVAPPPPEPEASPPETHPSEAAVEARWQEPPPPPEAPPAAAWTAPEPPLGPPGGADAASGTGALERDSPAQEPTEIEALPSPTPGHLPPIEPPEASDDLAQSVAPETLSAEPEPQREATEEAQRAPGDAPLAAIEAPAAAAPLSGHETLLPDSQEAAAEAPSAQAQAAPSAASIPVAAWGRPLEAKPPAPEPPARPFPGSLPRPLPRSAEARELPDLRRALAWIRLALLGTATAAVGLVVAVLALVVLYRWVNPPVSTLMIGRSLAGTQVERTWMPLERISPNLMRAVILSEDGGFCRHGGVDWAAIEEAIESDRGGSTITMQVVKNLFLWPSRSYLRKAIEIGLAYLVEALWPKRRILEIYLNIAEWGDGVFGAEAAAQAHFGKRAARLTAEEAALMAAVLPNPIERTAGAPSLIAGRLASRLLVRMRTSRADLSCVPVPRLEPRPAPPRSLPQRSPQRSPEKAPLVQGPRMTL
jgi:monofunctional glycosyltransferase